MKELALSDTAEPEYSSSLLDNEYTSARKRQRRAFHRIISGLHKGYEDLRLLTLTSSPDSPDFQKSFRKLRMRLLRRKLLLEYMRTPEVTKSGLRHDHIIFRGSYIEQAYISKLWGEIHGAQVVDIRRVRGNKRRMANYLAKYMAKELTSRISYSWGWVFKGFCGSWENLKRVGYRMGWDIETIIHKWELGIKLYGRGFKEIIDDWTMYYFPGKVIV